MDNSNPTSPAIDLCQLTLFGGFHFASVDNCSVNISAKKAKALLAYLAVHPDKAHQREYLAALLWEECSSSQARQSLRQTLSALRKAIPNADRVIKVGQQSVQLRRELVEVDALSFDALCGKQDPASFQRALDLFQGELLEGLYTGSQSFDDWLELERSHKREQALGIMEVLLEQARTKGKLEQVIRLGIRVTSLDPLRESAHRVLMNTYNKQRRRGAALKQYRVCQQLLRNELGIAPEQETQTLYQAIYRQQQAPTKTFVSPAAADDIQGDRGAETANASGNVAQLRHVTILIARIDVADTIHDPELHHALHQQTSRELTASIEDFGATIIDLQNGQLLALFGLSRARSNDTEKAARASLAIQNALTGNNQKLSGGGIKIGISSGQVYVSGMGDGSPLSNSVSGATLDQAMKLADFAQPGEILISSRAYATITRLVTADELSAKDSIEQKSVWRLVGLDHKLTSSGGQMVGRKLEVQQFLTAANNCKAIECGQVILVRGEAGIGKTRLLEEWLSHAGELGFDRHSVSILDFGTAIGQNPIQILARSLLRIQPDQGVRDIETNVEQTVANDILSSDKINFIYDLLNAPELLRDPELYLAMDNEARQVGKQEVITGLLQRLAEMQPLLITIEDIHWADTKLLTILGQLAADIRDFPVILVFSTRLEGEPLDPEWRSRIKSTSLVTLDISPLRQTEAEELVSQSVDLPPQRMAELIQRAGGNPLFLEQILFCAQQANETIPDSVQSIVASKLDTLNSFDKRAAFAASILGQRFSQEALNSILGDPDYRCSELVARGLVKPEGRQFLFHHALIMDGIYAIQIASQRRSLHLLAADWYNGKDPVLYAEHMDKAEDAKAAKAYLTAVPELIKLYQYDAAEKMARRGREIASETVVLFDLSISHADCLRELGQTQGSLDAFIAAEQQAESPRQQCQALLGQGHALRLLDRHQDVLSLMKRTEALAQPLGDIEAFASIYYLRGNACFFLGLIDDCLAAHEQAETLAATHDLPLIRARALSGIADAYYGTGRLISAERKYQSCVALCEQHGFIRDATANQVMIGAVLGFLNRYEDAEQTLLENLEVSKKVRNRRSEAMTMGELASLYCETNQQESARLSAKKHIELAKQIGSLRMQCDALLYLGTVNKDETLLEQAYEMAAENPFGNYYITSWILAVMARVTVDPSKRSWALREGESMLSAQALSHNQLMFYRYAIEACLASKDHKKARHFMTALENYTSAEPLPWSDFILKRAECLIRAAQGETSKALEHDLQILIAQADHARFLEPKASVLAALMNIRSSR